MSTYSGLVVRDYQKKDYQWSKGQVITFKYTKPFPDHYFYRGDVDNHNYMHRDGEKKAGRIR